MDISLKLDYIGEGIFDLSRWVGKQFVAERSGVMGKPKGSMDYTRSWMYADNVAVELEYTPATDGYSRILITVMYSGVEEECKNVVLACLMGCPAIVTFRYFDHFEETMSKEGGITEEFRGNEQCILAWKRGSYVRG